jgi:hypothetical protein
MKIHLAMKIQKYSHSFEKLEEESRLTQTEMSDQSDRIIENIAW